MQNVAVVGQIYEAFGRGDVPAILDHLAEDVEWEYGVDSTDVPWLQPRRGRQEVPGFFEALGALEIHSFAPKTMLESDDVVVAIVDFEATVKETGQRISEEDEAHIWHFAEGKVVRFRHRSDTHQHQLAYQGQGVSGAIR
ncbi:MAG TPA: nuclear transport factor 2 family protein [Rubrobacteraceae bacterium]|nr:nuclear transport factor 2 family protein [Rubrobacteraceae bacterium]